MTDHDHYEQDVGAYLLGALPPLEASVFERHLVGCDDCQRRAGAAPACGGGAAAGGGRRRAAAPLKASLMEVVEAGASASGRGRSLPARSPGRLGRLGAARSLALAAGCRVGCSLVGVAWRRAADYALTEATDEPTVRREVDQEPRALPRAAASGARGRRGRRPCCVCAACPSARGRSVYEVWVAARRRVEPAVARSPRRRTATAPPRSPADLTAWTR